MSFVLDALRRADAERQRGALPDLQTQPVPTLSPPAAAPRARPWWPALAGAMLVLLLLAAWWLGRRQASDAAPSATAPLAPAAQPASALMPPIAAPVAAPPPPVSPLAPPPVPAVGPAPQAQPAAAPRVAAAPAKAPAAATPASAAASTPAAPPRTPLLAELPDALRRELPPLAFGGAMDSPQPSSRMLIVNGQLLHEGDTVAPGLTLLTIRLRGALFEFKGTRFEVSY